MAMYDTGKKLDEHRLPNVKEFMGYTITQWTKGFQPMETRLCLLGVFTVANQATVTGCIFIAPIANYAVQPFIASDGLSVKAQTMIESLIREQLIRPSEELFFDFGTEKGFKATSQPRWWVKTLNNTV